MSHLRGAGRRGIAAVVVFLALAVFHTWPLSSSPARLSLNDNADAELNAWTVSWVAYALVHEPHHLFAGNIFQPDDRALAYSEPLIIPALAGAPIRWLGGSAVLTFNLLLVAGLAATGLAGWWVVFRWTDSFAAGLVGGALVAFNTHLLTRLPHLQAAHAWGLVLVIYLADGLLTPSTSKPRWWPLSLVIAAVAVTSAYWLFFAAVAILVLAAFARSPRALGRLALAGLVAILLALPVLLPYMRLAGEGIRRPIEQVAQLSATPAGYLVSLSRLDAPWSRRFFTKDVDVLFPGAIALVLAGIGLNAALKAGGNSRRRASALVALGVVGFVLSLGPATPVYVALHHVVLPLQGIRVAARFGYLLLLAVALLAGFGVAALERRLTAGFLSKIVAALALALVSAEAWHGPIKTTAFRDVPRIYAQLDTNPDPVLLVETPFWPADAVFGNAEYVLNASEHRAPIMNGYSGYTPDAYRRRASAFWFFPEPWAIQAMRREGATHVMVHLEQFGAEADAVKAVLEKQTVLKLVAADTRGHQLYRFVDAATIAR